MDEKAMSPKRISLVLVVVIILIIPTSLILLQYKEPVFEGLRVDGDFSEWGDALMITDTGTTSEASLDITEYAATTDDMNNLYIYARARAEWASSTGVGGVCVFIDTDNSADTGYKVEEMGAEYMFEIYGWDYQIRGRQFRQFEGTDQHNWSAWSTSSLNVAHEADRLEMSVRSTFLPAMPNYKLLFMTKAGEDVAEVCDARITPDRGALVVKQVPQVNAGIVANHTNNTVMNLELRAYGSDVTVSDMSFNFIGVGDVTVSGLPLTIPANTHTTLDVTAPVALLSPGTFVDISVSSVSSSGTVSIVGEGLKAYVNAPPGQILIDGAFADWNYETKYVDAGNVSNPDVDITEYATANTSSQAYFYLKVDDDGKMMGGGFVPIVRMKPGEPTEPVEPVEPIEPQPPRPLPRKTGEDVTRVFIDSQGSSAADFLLEMKGYDGEITSRQLFTLPGKVFIQNIPAANGLRELEASVPLSAIGSPTQPIQVYFETTDWNNTQDSTGAIEPSFNSRRTRSARIGFSDSEKPADGTLGTNTVLTCYYDSGSIPTVDGDYSAGEWAGTDSYDTGSLRVYTVHDNTYAYFCVVNDDDTGSTPDMFQQSRFCWDTAHDAGSSPDSDDKMYRGYWDDFGSAWGYDYWTGTGSGWSTSGVPGGSQYSAAYDSGEGCWVYECRIPLTTLNDNGNFDQNSETIGFCVDIIEGGVNTAAWPTSGDYNDPSTWGDLVFSTTDIPEFSAMVFPILVLILIPFLLRKRWTGGN
jgi:hypothetical protein